MAITTIPWGDGSGDNIYLSAPSQTGDQSVSVTSDPNTGAARSKVVTFSASGVSPVTLTINQAAGQVSPVFYNHLEFDGTAYIDTDITPDALASYRVVLGWEKTKAAQRIFLTRSANSTLVGAILGSTTNSTRRYFTIYYGNTASSNRYLAWTYESFTFYLTPYKFGWGNTGYTFSKGSNAPTGGLILGSNPAHGGQAYTGKMSIFRIYGSDAQNATDATDLMDNYTPVYTLRPCTYNGEAGMWCVETNKFYGNTAGAGTLTASN